ncbi:hypothetical protein [Enterobacter hormaechei]|uniref:hypothetical protein n=1 Tax=Enterobacter hormaechei TaxID=158836 RepID=UPI002874523F|nr:hypothetical protein [Enterobacter hormaechei]MDR9986386.1 hypothetical protein [Enterobacter hormaechei subsp. steigerwaltii]
MLIVIALLWCKKDIRDSFYQLIKTFFHKQILTVLGLAVIWTFICIALFYEIGVWSTNNLKTTLVWVITYAFVTIFETHKIKNSKYYFKSQIKETIGLSALLTFILELQSFSFAIEFIIYPIILFLGLLAVVANTKKETEKIGATIKVVLGIFGIFYFSHSLVVSIMSPSVTFSWGNLTELLTPVLLSFSFMPFIYMLYLYQSYETNLLSLKIYFDDEALFNYAKKLAIFFFRTDLDALNRWVRNIHINEINTKERIKVSLKDVKLRKKIEYNPPEVDNKYGWSPFLAKDFLVGKGINTNDYHFSFDTWTSCSQMIEIGADDLFRDNVAYYIYGDEHAAKKLKLRVHINNPPISNSSKNTISVFVEELISKALGDDNFNISELFSKVPVMIKKDNRYVSFTKEDFASQNGGYTLEVVIGVGGDYSQEH